MRRCRGRPTSSPGRYLAACLSTQAGDALGVAPQGEHAIPIETAVDLTAAGIKRGFGDLSDLPSR